MYTPCNPKIYDADDIKASIEVLKKLWQAAERGDILQDAGPALNVALDFLHKELEQRST